MEVTRQPNKRRRPIQKGKYHNPIEVASPVLAEMAQAPAVVETEQRLPVEMRVPDEAVTKALEEYARSTLVDMQNIADALGLSVNQTYRLLHSDKWIDAFENAKGAKGHAYTSESVKVAHEIYERTKNDNNVSTAAVKAAEVLVKYNMMVNRAMSEDFVPKSERQRGSGNITVNVVTGIKLNI